MAKDVEPLVRGDGGDGGEMVDDWQGSMVFGFAGDC
jgi:hypothetical protein